MKRTELHEGKAVRIGRNSKYTNRTHESVIVSLDRDFSTAAQRALRLQRAEQRGYRNTSRIDNTLIAVATKRQDTDEWWGQFVPAREILFTQEKFEAEQERRAAAANQFAEESAKRFEANAPVVTALNELLEENIFAVDESSGTVVLVTEESYRPTASIPHVAQPLVDALLKGLGVEVAG